MYNVDNILPFFDKATLVKSYRGNYETKEIYCDSSWYEVANRDISFKPRVYGAKIVRPMNLLIIDAPINEVVWVKEHYQVVSLDIQEVDYSRVAKVINVIQGEDKIAVEYEEVSGLIVSEVKTSVLIEQAIIGKAFKEFPLPSLAVADSLQYPVDEKEVAMSESISADDFKKMSFKVKGASLEGEKSPYIMRLDSYFRGSYTTARTPLLCGGTAVAKSAVVKSFCDELGMRLVDIRTAFISRLDLEGLSEKLDLGSSIESFNAPMNSMMECTDAYIEYCQKCIPILEAKLSEKDKIKSLSDIDDSVMKAFDEIEYEVLPKFREGAKTPVLFFDEITRGEASVRQALTKILSDKEFMGYSMKKARIIAATNSSGTLADELYLTKSSEDVAFFDRFETMFITPEDAFPGWLKWASGVNIDSKQNIHPTILDYINEDVSIAYDLSPVINMVSEGKVEDATSMPFKNYRAWEALSSYLYTNDESKEYNEDYVLGLIGASDFIQHLIDSGWHKEVADGEESDPMERMIRDGMKSGVPTLLIGPSAIGKTSRISKAVKDNNAVFININLAQQDRVDLMGIPAKVDINRYIIGSNSNLSSDITESLKDELKKVQLPPSVTIKAPKAYVIKSFKEAYESGRDIVLFFDELNRVQNTSIMTAVFEAISDHRIFGINFDPSRVKIMAACNLGENTADAKPLDPAFAARFSIYKKKKYDVDDVKSFRRYAKSSGFDPYMQKFLDDMSNDDLMSMLSSVETRTLEVSAASTRAIEDLSKFLKDKANIGIVDGSILFSSVVDDAVVTKLLRQGGTLKDLFDLYTIVYNKIDNWAALKSSAYVKATAGSSEVSIAASDWVDIIKTYYQEIADYIKSGRSPSKNDMDSYVKAISSVYTLDRSIKKYRTKVFQGFLGSYGETFGAYYNVVSGTNVVTLKITDISDIKNVVPYVKQEIGKSTNAEEAALTAIKIFDDVLDAFSDSLSVAHYRALIDSVLGSLLNSDFIYRVILAIGQDQSGKDKILAKAEDKDSSYIKGILVKAGVGVTDDQITGAMEAESAPFVLK